MPTDVSNSIGTARQFTPKPDRTYQGNYLGVAPTQSTVSDTSGTLGLAQNLLRLDAALQSHRVSHEKWLNAIGSVDAENMIHGMTPEDIKRLGVIDAAQQEGYADVTANPYFRAYAEKLRGGFLASQMKQEYDNQYAMQPASSIEEEQKRYSDFSTKYKDAILTDPTAKPNNEVSFNMGFDESNLVNVNQLGKQWVQTKHQEDVTNTMTAVQSQLSDIIRTAPALREENGAITQKVQEAFNTMGLMGVPAAQRYTLAYNFVKQLARTGALDGLRTYQMAQNVTIQTSMDGTTKKLADVLPMADIQIAADEYHAMAFTQERQDVINELADTMDEKQVNAHYDDLEKSDPFRTQEYEHDRQVALTKIKQKQAEQKAVLAQQAREDKANMKVLQSEADIRGSLSAWVQNMDMYNGTSIHSLSFSNKEQLSSIMYESMQYVLQTDASGNFVNIPDMSDKTRVAYLARIMSFPPASQMIKGMQSQYEGNIDTIQPDGNGGNTASQTAYTLYRLYSENVADFQQAFGESLTNKVGVISRLANMYNGDVTSALNAYAQYNVTPKETINAYQNDIKTYLGKYENHYTVELPTIGYNNTWGSAAIWQDANWQQRFATLGAVFMTTSNGSDMTGAINQVGALLQDGYRYYHGAMLPKMLWANLGLGADNETYMAKALDSLVYDFAGSYYAPNANEFDVSYNPESRILTITNPYTHQHIPYDADALRNQAQYIYNLENGGAQTATNNSSMTAEQANAIKRSRKGLSMSNQLQMNSYEKQAEGMSKVDPWQVAKDMAEGVVELPGAIARAAKRTFLGE